MIITKITSDKKYAKLDEDISFAIEYDAPLTDEELQTEWEVYYTPDIIFRDQRRKCNVVRRNENQTVHLDVQQFKESLNGLTTIELRNVGCFSLIRSFRDAKEEIILVVQTYSEDEVNVVLERAVEQRI